MTMPVRKQMVCIVAPEWPAGADLPKRVAKPLNDLFIDVGVVHFASIALLPAIPGEQKNPSLMLELVTEEGLEPDDLLYRLAFHPGNAMWSLFGVYWSTPPSVTSTRNQELLDRLVKWRSIADGCFVGARDRSVGQIMMERDLLEQARRKAHALKPQYGKDRAQFARALARWAFDDPSFERAVEPAPRSYWRGKGAGIGAKLAIPILVVVAWLAALWLMRPLSRIVARVDSWLFGDWNTPVQLASRAAGELSQYLLWSTLRFLLALAVVLFVGWVLLGALPALFKFYRRWLESLVRELDRPTDTWSSLSTYAAVWVVGLPLVLAVIWSIGVFTFVHGDLFGYTIAPLVPAAFGWKHLAGVVAVVVVLLAIIIVCRLDWFYRPHEDDVDRAQQVHPSIDRCEAELARGTAHIISLTDMRSPNWWSVWWTRLSLRFITLLGYVLFTEGRLGQAPGIHFGHWHIIDNGRRYLFCSSYDGNFGGYLDDFINGASVGTTLFWRWTKLKPRKPAATGEPGVGKLRHFPPSRFLVFRGVKCELRFKSYARDSMLPHLYRFDACNLTVDQIVRGTALRNALFGERNEVNDDQIMRAIEFVSLAPKLSDQLDDIQGIINSGYGWLRASRFWLLTISDGRENEARAWLAELVRSGLIVTAKDVLEKMKPDEAVAVAFSFAGLARLGLVETDDYPFPTPFRSGMGSELREKLLRDQPREKWRWSDVEGGENRRTVHVLVAQWYLEGAETKMPEPDSNAFVGPITPIESCPNSFSPDGNLYEPFGFRDGLSQPVIRGLRDPESDKRARKEAGQFYEDRVIAPGEFIVGYPNEYNELTYCPDVQRWTDARGRFTLNGSYLAVRQIQQNVEVFKAFAAANPGAAEKLMGRQQDGSPLFRKAVPGKPPPASEANAFRYRVDDANGLTCPLGAHIRRANPRDSLGVDVPSGIKSSKLHRLLRRGRPYLEKGGPEEVGLFFIACNADLERQFEFIHQRWLRNFRFQNLFDEDDPVVGSPEKTNFTIPALPSGGQVSLAAFTETRGGGYFFLPGIEALKFIMSDGAPGGTRGSHVMPGTVEQEVSQEVLGLMARQGP